MLDRSSVEAIVGAIQPHATFPIISIGRAALQCCALVLALSGRSVAQPIEIEIPESRPIDPCRGGLGLPSCSSTVGRLEGQGGVTADGAATYKIPIWVSPGRAGIEPSLGLSYNSQAGNGWVGLGWSLTGFPRITRCRRTFAKEGDAREIQFADGASGDRYCLDDQRLVVAGGPLGLLSVYGAHGTEYRTEHDRHAKIVSNAPDGLGPTSFTVYFKNGQVLTFGGTPATRLDGSRVTITTERAFLTNSPGVYSVQTWAEGYSTVRYLWALEEVRDRVGNYLRVSYQRDQDNFGYDLRPTTVSYTGFAALAGSSVADAPPNRSVEFTFEDRPDSIETFISGFRLLRAKRLQRIDVRGPSLAGSQVLLRSYVLEYAPSATSRRSLLSSVRECDGSGICKPATIFGWTPADTAFTDHVIAQLSPGDAVTTSSNNNHGPPRAGTTSWQVADVNGDGRDDLLGLGTVPPYNVPAVLFGNAVPGSPLVVPPGAKLVTGVVGHLEDGNLVGQASYIDLNGDSIPDRITLEPQPPPSGGPGFSNPPGRHRNAIYLSGPQGFSLLDDAQPFSPLARPAYAVDLNGDGLPDLVQLVTTVSDDRLVWQYRLNSPGGFGPWIRTTIDYINPGSHSPPDPFLGAAFAFDPTGSGRQSLLLAANKQLRRGPTAVETAPAGSGKQSLLLAADKQLRLGPTVETAEVTLAEGAVGHFRDLNCDGLLDWWGADSKAQINTGNGFSAPFTWTWTRPAAYANRQFTSAALFVAGRFDFDGDGCEDHLVVDTVAPHQLAVWLSTGRGSVLVPLATDLGEYTRLAALDVNGDGLTDLAVLKGLNLHVYTRNGERADLLAKVTDGLGAYETFDYAPIAEGGAVYAPASTGCSYPLSCVKTGLWVVKSHRIDNGDSLERSWSHSYAAGRMDLQTGAWLGFASWSIRDNAVGSITTVTSDNQTRIGTVYPYARLPITTVTRVETNVGTAQSRMHTQTQVATYQLVKPTPGSFFVYASEIHDRETEGSLNPYPPGLLPGLIRETVYSETQDVYGNVTASETQAYPIAGGRANGSPTRNKVAVTYDNFASSWLLGLARSTATTSTTPDSQTATRMVEYDYFPTTGLLWRTRLESQTRNASEVAQSGFFRETTLTRSPYGLVTAVRVDASGQRRVDALIYDPVDNAALIEHHNALGHVWYTEYHRGFGLATLQRDPNGVEVRTTYDGFGRPLVVVPQGRAGTTIYYDSDPAGHFRVRVSVQGSGTTELLYDRLGREISRSWDSGNRARALVETGYDLAGRIARVSLPRWIGEPAAFEEFTYDEMGRLTRTVHADHSAVDIVYIDGTVERWNEKGMPRYLVTDELGRIAVSEGVRPGTAQRVSTVMEYGPFDVLRKVTGPGGNGSTMEYDHLGRPTRIVDPNLGVVSSRYDAFGDLKSITDATGRETTTVRDLLGRPTMLNSSDGLTTFTWDTATTGIGKLAATRSPLGMNAPVYTRYEYNAVGRLAKSTWDMNGEAFSFDFGYDVYGRLETLKYPVVANQDRFELNWAYTPYGFAKSVTDRAGLVEWQVTGRDATGRVTAEKFGNGVTTTRAFYLQGRLARILTESSGTPVQDLEYRWELNGNLRRRYEHIGKFLEEFGYDELDRLTDWDAYDIRGVTGVPQLASLPKVSTHYAFDDLGNMRSRTLPDAKPGADTVNYGYGETGAGPSAVSSARIASTRKSFTYDPAGNQTSAPTRTATYSALNQLRSILPAGERTRFAYDALGQRVLKWSTDHSAVSVGKLYERRTSPNGTMHFYLIPGEGRIVAQVQRAGARSRAVAYLHDDHLGSIESVTDAEGARIEQRSYDPLGNRQDPRNRGHALATKAANAIRLGFAGHAHDDEIGTIDMRARIYDPSDGHFLSADPISPEPGDGQSWNRYAYVRNNPLTFVDPSGLQPNVRSYSQKDFEPLTITGHRTLEGGSKYETIVRASRYSPVEESHGGGSEVIGSAKPAAAADAAGTKPAATVTAVRSAPEKVQGGSLGSPVAARQDFGPLPGAGMPNLSDLPRNVASDVHATEYAALGSSAFAANLVLQHSPARMVTAPLTIVSGAERFEQGRQLSVNNAPGATARQVQGVAQMTAGVSGFAVGVGGLALWGGIEGGAVVIAVANPIGLVAGGVSVTAYGVYVVQATPAVLTPPQFVSGPMPNARPSGFQLNLWILSQMMGRR